MHATGYTSGLHCSHVCPHHPQRCPGQVENAVAVEQLTRSGMWNGQSTAPGLPPRFILDLMYAWVCCLPSLIFHSDDAPAAPLTLFCHAGQAHRVLARLRAPWSPGGAHTGDPSPHHRTGAPSPHPGDRHHLVLARQSPAVEHVHLPSTGTAPQGKTGSTPTHGTIVGIPRR